MKNDFSLALLSNIRIDTNERLLRLVDSFDSFKDINFNEYLIIIRGIFKEEARSKLVDLGVPESSIYIEETCVDGWLQQTANYRKKLSSSLFFLWLEDHIFLNEKKYLESVVHDFYISDAQYLYYSFHTKRLENDFSKLPSQETMYCKIFQLSRDDSWWIKNNIYCSSLVTFIKAEYFDLIMNSIKYSKLNWSFHTPFNFERASKYLPLDKVSFAFPKKELFASIDDDMDPGYSLISRNLYPDRINRDSLRVSEGLTSNFKLSIRPYLENNQIFIFFLVKYRNIKNYIKWVLREKN